MKHTLNTAIELILSVFFHFYLAVGMICTGLVASLFVYSIALQLYKGLCAVWTFLLY